LSGDTFSAQQAAVIILLRSRAYDNSLAGMIMTTATLNYEPNGPLNRSQLEQVATAKGQAHTIRKAAAVAGFNGWTIGILALGSAPFAWFSLPALLMTVGMSLVAYNELQGRRRLLRFDDKAPAFLGWNQLGFLGLIITYCLWMFVVGFTGESPLATEFEAKPELRAAFDSVEGFDEIYRIVVAAFYGIVILLSAIFQGGNAIYYFTRRRHVEAFLQKTPAWALQLLV